jgi:hypothetical protein
MAKQEQHKPGEKSKESGQYPIIGPAEVGQGTTVTGGKPFPTLNRTDT